MLFLRESQSVTLLAVRIYANIVHVKNSGLWLSVLCCCSESGRPLAASPAGVLATHTHQSHGWGDGAQPWSVELPANCVRLSRQLFVFFACFGCVPAETSLFYVLPVNGEHESRIQKGNGYFQVPPHTPVIFGEAGGRTLFRWASSGKAWSESVFFFMNACWWYCGCHSDSDSSLINTCWLVLGVELRH